MNERRATAQPERAQEALRARWVRLRFGPSVLGRIAPTGVHTHSRPGDATARPVFNASASFARSCCWSTASVVAMPRSHAAWAPEYNSRSLGDFRESGANAYGIRQGKREPRLAAGLLTGFW